MITHIQDKQLHITLPLLLTPKSLSLLLSHLHAAESDTNINAIVLKGRKHFCLGADIRHFPPSQTIYALLKDFHSQIQQLQKKRIALLKGHCIGGGLELALLCHQRVVIGPSLFSLPEIRIGLIPGLGATQRLPRLIGLEASLPILLSMHTLNDKEALKIGLVDTTSIDTEIPKRTTHNPSPYQQPHPLTFASTLALTYQKTHHCYANVSYLLQAVYEGSMLNIETALHIEALYFTKTLLHPQTRSRLAIAKQIEKPSVRIQKLGIIGAGFMGSAIQAIAIKYQIPTIVLDTDPKKSPSNDLSLLKDCDLIIEAISEDKTLKQSLLSDVEPHLSKNTVIVSNTSTIPIAQLATSLQHPERFCGMHFLSPVEKIPLIEIIPHDKTSDKTEHFAQSFAKQIKKHTITVKDTYGFYTTQMVMAYTLEALTLLTQGISPVLIENAAKQLGMRTPPLALLDEVGIDIAYFIVKQSPKPISQQIILDLKTRYENNQLGRKTKKGFYDYTSSKRLLPSPYPETTIAFQVIKERLLNAQKNLAVTLVQQGIVSSYDANIGAVLGLGFCPFLGGPISSMVEV